MRRGILRTGETEMSVATVLRVFKNSSLVTERGEFKISRVFDNAGAASKARYRYHCTESGVTIYSRHTEAGTNKFAVVGK
jgi:DNA-directed RNA polymerase specialized sigma54-like protein